LIRKVGLYYVEKAIALILARIHTHPALHSSVFVNCHPREQSYFSKSPVVIVFEQQTRCRIIRDVNIGPSIVVIVGNARGKTISRLAIRNSSAMGYISRGLVVTVVI